MMAGMSIAKRTIAAAAGALAALAAVAFVAAASAPPPSISATARCGAKTQGIITADDESAARVIYEGELASFEVRVDLKHVQSSRALASAVAGGDQAAVETATHAIVYTPHWHIVRLRVLSRAGKLVADVGGPDVLAPVTGQVRYHGKIVGSFVMSVQDDLGYEKLVTRFVGLPIELYSDGEPLMGLDFPAADVPPALVPDGTPITVNGVNSVTVTYPVLAFPTGDVHVLLAIPAATPALEAASCAEVNVQTHGEVFVHLANHIDVRKYPAALVTFDLEFNYHELTFVRAGSTQLASSNDLPGPAFIPRSGTVSYDGKTWFVYSLATKHAVHVYLLFPDTSSPGSGASGQSGSSGSSGAS
jgi:hypothetical protein